MTLISNYKCWECNVKIVEKLNTILNSIGVENVYYDRKQEYIIDDISIWLNEELLSLIDMRWLHESIAQCYINFWNGSNNSNSIFIWNEVMATNMARTVFTFSGCYLHQNPIFL